ncbi:hypothetical protein SAMN04488577_2344 [Bacillus sp. cl95]|nr:hypothetical protein SAMN02799634_102224 [Bacillus sp. UNCCL13]SFQ84205.1 hypothetical protein SAMN04488577_2344 [Bacillus sp. cl95]
MQQFSNNYNQVYHNINMEIGKLLLTSLKFKLTPIIFHTILKKYKYTTGGNEIEQKTETA